MKREDLELSVFRRLTPSLRALAIRFGTPNYTVGSLAWLTDNGERVLLTRPAYREGWLPSGGFVQRGESALQTVTREVREELGVPADVRPYHRVHHNVERRGVTFVSAGLIPEDAQFRLSSEILEVKWFDLDNMPVMPPDFTEGIYPEDVVALRQLTRKP